MLSERCRSSNNFFGPFIVFAQVGTCAHRLLPFRISDKGFQFGAFTGGLDE
jgi:hypothetical protein